MNNNINSSILDRQYDKLREDIAKQDVYRAFVLNANSVAPQQNKAYLLKSRNPVSSIIIGAADTGKDVIELGKALATGKSNDNQLGRFNDLGMKLGGLGIASYLFTRRGTGTKGIMEFLGFGAFFASMAMWPRILISEPLKHRFGFDIRQQYVDAQGRKKRLYLDNQFIPDLYSDEEIDKVADKMGIDKSIPDYKQLTKEKMRTIALQGNTLWMLTAGFSPLLTSMICNLGERGVTRYIVNSKYNKILSDVDRIDEVVKQYIKQNPDFNKEDMQKLHAMLEDRTKAPDNRFFANVASYLDPFKQLSVAKDADDANLVSDFSSFAPRISERLKNDFENIKSKEVVPITLEYHGFIGRLRGISQSGTGINMLQGKSYEGADFFNILAKKLDANKWFTRDIHNRIISTNIDFDKFMKSYEEVLEMMPDNPVAPRILKEAQIVLAEQDVTHENAVRTFCESVRKNYIPETRKISPYFQGISEFVNGLVGQKYESVHTTLHRDSLKAFMDALGTPAEELENARHSVENSKKYLIGALSSIAGNDASYGEFVENITAKQAKLEARTIDKVLTKVEKYADEVIARVFAEKIDDNSPLAFYKNETVPVRKLGETQHEVAPLYEKVINLFVKEKGAGIKATGHRYLLAADLEKRIQTGELLEFWKELGYGEDTFEAAKKACRDIIYDGTMNDLSNKFYLNENGLEAPKIIRLLFGVSDRLDEHKEPVFGLSRQTIEHCDEKLIDALEATRRNILGIYAQTNDLARQGHRLAGSITANQKTQYSMVGKSVSELFMETASQTFNDKRWMKTFGGLGIAVVALTLLSQAFFGKARHEHLYKPEKNNAQGGVNAGK